MSEFQQGLLVGALVAAIVASLITQTTEAKQRRAAPTADAYRDGWNAGYMYARGEAAAAEAAAPGPADPPPNQTRRRWRRPN